MLGSIVRCRTVQQKIEGMSCFDGTGSREEEIKGVEKRGRENFGNPVQSNYTCPSAYADPHTRHDVQ
jgi:hypothetical protein